MKHLGLIMSVLEVDGQVIGTGYTGHKMPPHRIGDADKMIEHLRKLKLIKGTRASSISVSEWNNEYYINIKGETKIIIRPN